MSDLAMLAEGTAPEDIPDLLGEIERAKAILWSRLLTPPVNGNGTSVGDFNLTPDDVATRLGQTKRWVYRHGEDLGGKRLGHRTLRFSEAGIRAYLASR